MELNNMSAAAGGVLSAGIGFLGNLGGSVGGGLFSANQARKNRAFQERMYKQQYQDSIDFWKMQNEYNLPSAQLERLRQANLNPLLMYGEGGISGNIASQAPQLPQQPHGAQGQVSSFNTRIDLANLGLLAAQERVLNAQASNLEQQTTESESRTEGLDFLNWLNDHSRQIQLAFKYRDYDYINSLIDKNRNEVFQTSFRNGSEMASLSLMNSLAIRRQNLSEFEVGNNVMQGWEAVISGRISANAQLKSAFAAMMNATTAAKVGAAQIGLMRAQAANYDEVTRFYSESRSYRVEQEFQKSRLLRKEVTWYDLTKEANFSEQQSRTFLNTMQETWLNTQNEWKPFDELMTPINMLTGFGAGMLTKKAVTPMPSYQGWSPSMSGN